MSIINKIKAIPGKIGDTIARERFYRKAQDNQYRKEGEQYQKSGFTYTPDKATSKMEVDSAVEGMMKDRADKKAAKYSRKTKSTY